MLFTDIIHSRTDLRMDAVDLVLHQPLAGLIISSHFLDLLVGERRVAYALIEVDYRLSAALGTYP